MNGARYIIGMTADIREIAIYNSDGIIQKTMLFLSLQRSRLPHI